MTDKLDDYLLTDSETNPIFYKWKATKDKTIDQLMRLVAKAQLAKVPIEEIKQAERERIFEVCIKLRDDGYVVDFPDGLWQAIPERKETNDRQTG